jgi:hypothetical protein
MKPNEERVKDKKFRIEPMCKRIKRAIKSQILSDIWFDLKKLKPRYIIQ